ncbi:hypothetical protein [Candidatus Lucifugimonas marina]|uniref:Uncharacterized protein n=1 Tax=Candidatus Lucifugimonas marina TaxID=3038979 RepID=A0AAJ6CUM9_9CHLR|nr:hypothetical protein [SAR202 cluster bacterium JH702]MDG0868336.1 hypothetical protein [SAR202 cluster bacterium JH639]WFG34973.1 hypothetical protein GKN94_04475 [SAR202 cluster bacterium JH545]WFG38930.1 hypothetical protein GKO48_04640 [SAR202 cluster bacterium JH1073]
MHKYQAPVQENKSASKGDRRSSGRRLFDSVFPRALKVVAVLLAVYAPLGMFFGVILIMAPIDQNVTDELQFESSRRQFGFAALGVIASGAVAAYGSYRLWMLAFNVRRSVRRRTKGLE